MTDDYARVVAELAACRAENAALRIALQAIRSLTDMTTAGGIPNGAPLEISPTPAPEPAPEPAKPRLRFLDALMTDELRPGTAKSVPFWAPKLSGADRAVQYGAYSWEREHDCETTVLDRSGSHLSAASSVRIGLEQLHREDEVSVFDKRPGFRLVPWFPWNEGGTPHPLGGAARGAEIRGFLWVTHVRAALIADLIEQGRIDGFKPSGGWVSDSIGSLSKWTTHVNKIRCDVIDEHGRDEEYDAVKRAFGQAVTMMKGFGDPREWKPDCWVRRPDWAYAIEDLSSVSVWRMCDELGAVARHAKLPELAPVAIRHTDELVIPSSALELFTTAPRYSRAKGTWSLKPLTIDDSGKTLGTWKTK